MLKKILKTIPPTKCVLIQDNLEFPGKEIFNYIIKDHVNISRNSLNYYTCEGDFLSTKSSLHHTVNVFDLASDCLGWIKEENRLDLKTIAETTQNAVIIIDSLGQLILRYGFVPVYKVIHELKSKTNIVQVLMLFHKNTIEDEEQIIPYFEHLCSLNINLAVTSERTSRLEFEYKKPGGKIVKELEGYTFENGNLISEAVEGVGSKVVLKTTTNEVVPDDLTTFRISLDDKEKQSREKLVLPYLPKETDEGTEGKVFYQFDQQDDWDEEDPDDDLEI